MLSCFFRGTTQESGQAAVPIYHITQRRLTDWLSTQSEFTKSWVSALHFSAKSGAVAAVPNQTGGLQCVLFGVEDDEDFWSFGALPRQLPKGLYGLVQSDFLSEAHYCRAVLAWGLGAYQFTQYQSAKPVAQLALPEGATYDSLCRQIELICTGRDWVNMPAEMMTPEYLGSAVKAVAKASSAHYSAIVGEKLLKANYPAIHAVGRASACEPRLLELTWGHKSAPRVTLVGKGVCFDSGGLDLKPPTGLRTMKRDMAGAAHALTLAHMIMEARLPVRLRLLIPAVENFVAANAYRPGDVIKTRSGITVEVDNTDAEGRLILCDALAAAAEEKPDLLIDFATLTGAAYVALGADLPALYCNNESFAQSLLSAAEREKDPIWQMPLYQPYAQYLESDIADCSNMSVHRGAAGSIIAALYLQKFVPHDIAWAHFDCSAWNEKSRPGRPKGAEILAVRAVFSYLKQQFPPAES